MHVVEVAEVAFFQIFSEVPISLYLIHEKGVVNEEESNAPFQYSLLHYIITQLFKILSHE